MSPSDQTVPAESLGRKAWERFTPEQEAAAIERHLAGDTVRQIAEDMDRPVGSVYAMLRRRGVSFAARGNGTTGAA